MYEIENEIIKTKKELKQKERKGVRLRTKIINSITPTEIIAQISS